jgi:hypothetical protein
MQWFDLIVDSSVLVRNCFSWACSDKGSLSSVVLSFLPRIVVLL